MKKIFAAILCLAVILSLAACAGNSGGSSGSAASSGSDASSGSAAPADASTDIDWPKKTIEVIIPFAAGGDSDAYLRGIAPELGKILGTNVIVTNMTGEALPIIADVLRRDADGYTVFYYNTSLNVSEAGGKYGDVSLINDMVPAGGIAYDGNSALFVRGDSGITNFEEFLEKASEPTFKFATGTANTETYIGRQIEIQTGRDFNLVAQAPNTAERILQLVSGEVDAIICNYGTMNDYLATGDVVCVAMLSDERNPAAPDVPTAIEMGVDVANPKRYIFRMRSGVDQAIVDKFTAALEQAVASGCLEDVCKIYSSSAVYISPADQQAIEVERTESYREFFESEG